MTRRYTFGFNDFYRRQTPHSKYSHFTGTDEQLLQAVEQYFPLRKPGHCKGAWIVPLPGRLGSSRHGAYFYTPVVKVHRNMLLNAEVIARTSVEPQLICASGIGKKVRAMYSQAIVYSADLLQQLGEASGDCDFELISIRASDVPDQPEHPYDIARQIMEGKSYDLKAVAEAIIYWGERVYVKKNFTKHVDAKIAGMIVAGDLDRAVKVRQKKCPDETQDEAVEYVGMVQQFLTNTGQYYR